MLRPSTFVCVYIVYNEICQCVCILVFTNDNCTFLIDDITDNTYVACDWDSRWKEECYDLTEAEVCNN